MVKYCKARGCKTQPSYNVEGQKKGLFCEKHKEQGMVDVINKKCKAPGCKTQPRYNVEGQKKGLFCEKHKEQGMVNVISKKCKAPGCKTRPTYNVEGQKKGLFCEKHKEQGMVNVISKKCKAPGCKTQPRYNVEGQKKGLFCEKHKEQGMVNVISKKCKARGCKTRPTYNVEGESKALFCEEHKKEGMVNVISKTCKNDWCMTIVTEKYEGYCLRCYIHTFPDKPVPRNYKTKEFAVVEYVNKNFPDFQWVANKRVAGGCSRKLPDLLLDLGYQVIILEIDENQHDTYDCSCENKRIMELSQDVGHRPIVFLRFNPDDYKIKDKIITSCWGLNKNGICVVRKSKTKEWEERLKTLEDVIRYWTNPDHATNKLVEVISLFFDEL